MAVIGAGGIGFDVSEYLLGEKALETPAEERLKDVPSFLKVCYLVLRIFLSFILAIGSSVRPA